MELPYILHLETSSRNCSVAVSHGPELVALCEEESDGYAHSEKLHLFAEYAMEGAQIEWKDLSAIHLSAGPGSYTGLRIGAAAAKGYCYALEVPLMVSDTSLILAKMAKFFEIPPFEVVFSMMDARRMEVYLAAYEASNYSKLIPVQPFIFEESDQHSANKFFTDFENKFCVCIGDGCRKAIPWIESFCKEVFPDVLPSAKAMPELGMELFTKSHFIDAANFSPNYLKNNYV